jgi:hypothetical protein
MEVGGLSYEASQAKAQDPLQKRKAEELGHVSSSRA